jgi:hypothetical protein
MGFLVACGGQQGGQAGDSGGLEAQDGSRGGVDASANDGGQVGSGDGSVTMSQGDAALQAEDGATVPADAGQYPLADLDETCEGGPTGRQLLAYVGSSYTGIFTPPATRAPAQPSALAITASYDGGAIECTPSPPYECCAGCPCRTQTPPIVSVNLDVGFKTADGTLDESFVGTATFDSDVNEVQWTATLARSAVKGTYPFSTGSTDLAFSGTFATSSSISGVVTEEPSGPGLTTVVAGDWTANVSDGGN